MTLTIKTIHDIDKLKLYALNNPRQPLCYVSKCILCWIYYTKLL